MAQVEYLTRPVRIDDIGGAIRREFSIPGMPGVSKVCVDYPGGISEETVALDGVRYLTIHEAVAAWRMKRIRYELHDIVGNALHQLMLGDECLDWGTMPEGTKQGWISGAETFLQKLNGLGMQVTKQPERGD